MSDFNRGFDEGFGQGRVDGLAWAPRSAKEERKIEREIEAAIRADERARVIAEIAGELEAEAANIESYAEGLTVDDAKRDPLAAARHCCRVASRLRRGTFPPAPASPSTPEGGL